MEHNNSMRSIDPALKDLILHIQSLEEERENLKTQIYELSCRFAREAEDAQKFEFKCARLLIKMEEASKKIRKSLLHDETMDDNSVRLLWEALEYLE